jgi:hypothetical protein
VRKSRIFIGFSIPGLWDFHILLYRQGARTLEAKERKKFHEVSRRRIFYNVRWHPYGCDITVFSDLVGSFLS